MDQPSIDLVALNPQPLPPDADHQPRRAQSAAPAAGRDYRTRRAQSTATASSRRRSTSLRSTLNRYHRAYTSTWWR